jgi:hypothetical protein
LIPKRLLSRAPPASGLMSKLGKRRPHVSCITAATRLTPDSATTPGFLHALAFEQKSHRTMIDQFHVHVGLKDACPGYQPRLADLSDHILV